MTTSVHEVASQGFGTGTGSLYDRARPSYPSDALAAIRAHVKGAGPYNILEVGSGTGIFTRALLVHPDWQSAIGTLTAIEPSSDFRATFSERIQDARVTAKEGTFQATGAPDGWADAVIVAQAWHWCPDYDASMKEFARVLKPDGVAFFIWNLEDRDRANWVKRLRDTIELHEKGTPQFRLGLWRKTFSTPSYRDNFEEEQELTWSYDLQTTVEGVLDRACSKSYIAILEPTEKATVVKEVEKILSEEQKVWIDEQKGLFEYPYKTYLVVMRKKASA